MERKITDLPVEILDLIFKKLYLIDKVMLIQADDLLKNAFCFHCGSEFSQIHEIDITSGTFPTIFQTNNSTIEYIKMKKFKNKELILVGQNYPDMLSINLRYLTALRNLSKFLNLKMLKNPISMTLVGKVCDSTVYTSVFGYLTNIKSLRFCLEKSIFKFVVVRLDNVCTLPELETLSFIGNRTMEILISLAYPYAMNKLRCLRIEHSYIYDPLPSCTNLRNLVLRSTHFSSNEIFCAWIERLGNTLESLDLDRAVMDFIDVKYTSKWSFPKWKELRIDRHRSEEFRFPYCPRVQSLSLENYTDTAEDFQCWISMFKNNLYSLELTDRVFRYETLPCFPQLRSFVLKISLNLTNDFTNKFYEWITKQSISLENLEILCRDEKFFLESISCCKKLRSISWHSFPKAPSKELWPLLFNILQRNGYTSEKPLKLKAYLGSEDIEKVKELEHSELCMFVKENT